MPDSKIVARRLRQRRSYEVLTDRLKTMKENARRYQEAKSEQERLLPLTEEETRLMSAWNAQADKMYRRIARLRTVLNRDLPRRQNVQPYP